MATLDHTVPTDLKFLDLFYKHRYPNEPAYHYDITKAMVTCGELQIETLQENTLVELNPDIVKESTYGRDFSDGSDSKKVTSVYRNNQIEKGNWLHSFPVRNIATKKDGLRIVGYNVLSDTFHFWAIPYGAYSHLTHVLEITIESYRNVYTDPCTGVSNTKCKWDKYEVDTLHELANRDVSAGTTLYEI